MRMYVCTYVYIHTCCSYNILLFDLFHLCKLHGFRAGEAFFKQEVIRSCFSGPKTRRDIDVPVTLGIWDALGLYPGREGLGMRV